MVRGRRRADLRVREGGRTLVLHGDHAGSIESVDTGLLDALLARGCVPVICPPALGHDGVPINVDGDRLTAELAIALRAERMVIFSDTDGFLADPARRRARRSRRATLDDLPGAGRRGAGTRAGQARRRGARPARRRGGGGAVRRGRGAAAAARAGGRAAAGSGVGAPAAV